MEIKPLMLTIDEVCLLAVGTSETREHMKKDKIDERVMLTYLLGRLHGTLDRFRGGVLQQTVPMMLNKEEATLIYALVKHGVGDSDEIDDMLLKLEKRLEHYLRDWSVNIEEIPDFIKVDEH